MLCVKQRNPDRLKDVENGATHLFLHLNSTFILQTKAWMQSFGNDLTLSNYKSPAEIG